jgi:hypothetical protein
MIIIDDCDVMCISIEGRVKVIRSWKKCQLYSERMSLIKGKAMKAYLLLETDRGF